MSYVCLFSPSYVDLWIHFLVFHREEAMAVIGPTSHTSRTSHTSHTSPTSHTNPYKPRAIVVTTPECTLEAMDMAIIRAIH